jgi:hypothetical protein
VHSICPHCRCGYSWSTRRAAAIGIKAITTSITVIILAVFAVALGVALRNAWIDIGIRIITVSPRLRAVHAGTLYVAILVIVNAFVAAIAVFGIIAVGKSVAIVVNFVTAYLFCPRIDIGVRVIAVAS